MGFIKEAFKTIATPKGVGNLFNDITGASSSAKNQFNNQMALQQNAQNFAKWQMGNAHQTEIKDLEAAGLNPILSAGGGGASATVGGGTASAGTPAGNPIDMIMGLLTTAKGVEKTNAEIKNINADTNQKETNTIWTPELNKSLIELQNATTAKTRKEAIKTTVETLAIKFNNKMKEMDINKRTREYDKELEIYKANTEAELIKAGYDKSTVKQVIDAMGHAIHAISPMVPMAGTSTDTSYSKGYAQGWGDSNR